MGTPAPLTITTLVEYFHIHGAARNLSDCTQKYYRGQLKHLVAKYGATAPDTLTVHALRALVAELRTQRAWSIGQTNHFVTSVKAFYSYLEQEDLIPGNPAARLEKLKGEQHLLNVLTREEMQALMAVR